MNTPGRSLYQSRVRALVLVSLFALPSLATSADKLQVTQSTLTATNAVLWVARDRALFQRHGLEVNLIYVAGVRALQALIAQEAQLASVAGTAPVQANLAGADTVIIGGISNSVLMSLVAAPDVTSIEGLRGKRVGVTRFGSLSYFMARTYLRRSGLTPDREVALIQTGGYPEAVAAMQAGAIQAAMLSPPYHMIAMKRLGFRELADMSKTMKYQANALVTLRGFAQTHSATVMAFYKPMSRRSGSSNRIGSSRSACSRGRCEAMIARFWTTRTAFTGATLKTSPIPPSRGCSSSWMSWRLGCREPEKPGRRTSWISASCRLSMRPV